VSQGSAPAVPRSPRVGVIIVCGASVLLLLGAAFARWPYGYYTFLRLVVCGTAIYLAILAWGAGRSGWVIVLVLTALLFNPVFLVRMRRADWQPFDIGAAIVLGAASWRFGLRRGSAG